MKAHALSVSFLLDTSRKLPVSLHLFSWKENCGKCRPAMSKYLGVLSVKRWLAAQEINFEIAVLLSSKKRNTGQTG